MKNFLLIVPLLLITYYLFLVTPALAQDPPPADTNPPPQMTSLHYSFEKSVGDFNEYVEGKMQSGTRQGDPIEDISDPNNYGAMAVLLPAGIGDELRVGFVKNHPDYVVTLATGEKKTAKEIWNLCTNSDSFDNWQNDLEKLNKCTEWNPVPTTYRCEGDKCDPKLKTVSRYYEEKESPFVQAWNKSPFVKLFQGIFCGGFGWFCPAGTFFSLKNPSNAPGWTSGKANIPQEATNNAQTLRKFLLPKDVQDLSLNSRPQGNNTYFDTSRAGGNTQNILNETGLAAQQIAADGGLFRIFQPEGIVPTPALCQEDSFNPGACASDFYFNLEKASPDQCPDNLCHADTPDQKTNAPARPTDDRPLMIRTQTVFTKKSLWPLDIPANF